MRWRCYVKCDPHSERDGTHGASIAPALPIIGPVILCLCTGIAGNATAQIEELAAPPLSAANTASQPDDAFSPGYLGVILDDRNDRGRGVRVVDVLHDGPAAHAGLTSGDLLTRIDGDAIGSIQGFFASMRGRAADSRVTFIIERNGALIEIGVQLGTRPPPESRAVPRFGRMDNTARLPIDETTGARPGRLGVVVVPVNDDIRRRLHLPDHRGAVVTAVAKGSPAAHAKLPIGAAIVAMDNEPVDGPRDLLRLITTADSGKSVLLAYLMGARLHECEVMLADVADISTHVVTPSLSPSAPGLPPSSEDIESLKRRVRELEAAIRRLEQ